MGGEVWERKLRRWRERYQEWVTFALWHNYLCKKTLLLLQDGVLRTLLLLYTNLLSHMELRWNGGIQEERNGVQLVIFGIDGRGREASWKLPAGEPRHLAVEGILWYHRSMVGRKPRNGWPWKSRTRAGSVSRVPPSEVRPPRVCLSACLSAWYSGSTNIHQDYAFSWPTLPSLQEK